MTTKCNVWFRIKTWTGEDKCCCIQYWDSQFEYRLHIRLKY